jgi:hypothetical protein
MKLVLCRKTFVIALVLTGIGGIAGLGYLWWLPQNVQESYAPKKQSPGIYSSEELAAAVAKYPAATGEGPLGTIEDSGADMVPPEPVRHKGNAQSAEKFRAVMDEAGSLQAEWKIFTADHRSAPRNEWNRAARQWQQARASRLDAVRDGAGITFPLRHPSEEPSGTNNDALVPDYLNPQRTAPVPANVLAFRQERGRLAAARDAAVHATAGLPPAKRMQKMKEWEDTNQTRLAANRSAAFMLGQLPLEVIPPVPVHPPFPANTSQAAPAARSSSADDPSAP